MTTDNSAYEEARDRDFAQWGVNEKPVWTIEKRAFDAGHCAGYTAGRESQEGEIALLKAQLAQQAADLELFGKGLDALQALQGSGDG